jgi:hypothetical protein
MAPVKPPLTTTRLPWTATLLASVRLSGRVSAPGKTGSMKPMGGL